MSLTPLELNGKLLFAFLNGVCKITFYKDSGVTAADVKDSVFPDKSLGEVQALLAEYAAVFRHAASQAWGWQELSAHLAALGVTADADTAAWAKVWKAEQATAHEFLVQRSIWNNTLEGVNWRVDLLSAGAQQQQQHGADEAGMMEPVALMQLKTHDESGAASTLQFEMDKAKVKELLGKMQQIQKILVDRS